MSASAQADCSNIAPSDPNVTSEWLETLRTERFHHIHHETKVSHLIKELKELRELFDMFKGNYVSSCLLSSLEFCAPSNLVSPQAARLSLFYSKISSVAPPWAKYIKDALQRR